ncbi:MAG: filamentous hemagglutinin N-terminal domain-containing protein [Nitrospira sp.]|nr:filamentous hemagglutinin N-terminal domain-containing protein [Nitrospira sp.]
MKHKVGRSGTIPGFVRIIALIFATFISFLSVIPGNARAAVATSITPTTGAGIPNTTVTQNGNVYNITDGTRAGTNLFHSFGNFSVGAGDIANFLNTPVNGSLPLTSNILGRVTGGNVSNLFGTIQTTGFGNANLFLMNPAGIVFGPTATLNVGGSVTFTTANSIRLTDTGILHADPTSTSVLTSAPVAAFGFLGSNPGAITVQGSNLSVPTGQSLSFIAGDIAIGPSEATGNPPQPAHIAAPEGRINLVSGASTGEVMASTFQPTPGMAGGSITLGPGTLVDVSGNAGGTVRIRGGSLVMDNATISADTVNANGALSAVDIQLTGDLLISADLNPAVTARTTGSGNAGDTLISSANMSVTATTEDILAVIDPHTTGSGRAGNVTITTGNLQVDGSNALGLIYFIDSGTIGLDGGHGGDVTITARTIDVNTAPISTGQSVALQSGEDATGSAGNVRISADSLHMTLSPIVTDGGFFDVGRAGDITVTAHEIMLDNSDMTALSFERGGQIRISANHLLTNESMLHANTASLAGGGVSVSADTIELTNGSQIVSDTAGNGAAGSIIIVANDHITLSAQPPFFRPSGIFSNSFGRSGSFGDAASVTITTPRLEMLNGSRINTITKSSGRGGDVAITTTGPILISGEFPKDIPEPLFSLGTIHPSGIFTSTIGGKCSGPCGSAGNIAITTGSLAMGTGSQIDSGTSSNGQGGNITIAAIDKIAMSGTLTTSQPGGIQSRTIGTAPDAGSGGNIFLTAGQSVTISDGASVSASSTGPGNAGNIAINAGQQFEMRNSSVKTEAAQASGGNIDIQAIDRIRLVNSSISTSVLGGSGSGGNITIDPNVVILQNSQVIAQAVQGAGGNISITTPLFLADASSLVDASSQFGLNGTVNIQSPTSNLAGTVSSLPSSLRQVQSLQTGRCAALADSRSSSLIVAGRDILPAEPGGWSPSPFALIMEQTEPLALASEESSPLVAAMTASADAPVSLRRLTPAGFLTQRFAESGLTGCRA